MDLDKSFHVLALPLDPGPPAVELAGALGAVEAGLVADDDRYAAILALAVDRDVGLALEGLEAEGLGHLDKLELLLLGELAGEAEGGEVVEEGLLLDLDGGAVPRVAG
jgi:hypothetical protein